jgi:hypothetical protein
MIRLVMARISVELLSFTAEITYLTAITKHCHYSTVRGRCTLLTRASGMSHLPVEGSTEKGL